MDNPSSVKKYKLCISFEMFITGMEGKAGEMREREREKGTEPVGRACSKKEEHVINIY